MTLRTLGLSINLVISRNLRISSQLHGTDSRVKRSGHIAKTDKVEGEHGAIGAIQGATMDLIDENLMETVINNVKFKDIPILHVKCTRNNTKVTLTTGDGSRVYILKTCGAEGYKNCRKGTTVAAQAVANRVVTYAKDNDINMARLVFNGLGPGRGAAYKVFEGSGINIVSLSDRTEAIEPWIRRPRKAKRI